MAQPSNAVNVVIHDSNGKETHFNWHRYYLFLFDFFESSTATSSNQENKWEMNVKNMEINLIKWRIGLMQLKLDLKSSFSS